ncbi:lipase family protein [Nocardia heshunensis]
MNRRSACTALVFAAALCAAPTTAGAAAPPPNGTVIDSHPISPYGLPLPVQAWQVRFASSDENDQPNTGLVTIVEPTTPWTGPGARPLLSYQLAEDSLGTQCAPSVSIEKGLADGLNNSNGEAATATLALQRGWAVAFPDYQGPHERFLDKNQAAHGVLDGLRAARAFAPADLSSSPIGMLGYSGGSLATTWAAQQLPSYAPELTLAGIAVGGVPVDVPAVFRTISGTQNAGLGILALAAFDRLFPEANIPALLNDRGRRMLAETTGDCGFDFVTKYMFADIDDYTAAPDIGDNPALREIAAEISVAESAPPAPTYFWHSTGDDVLPIAFDDRLATSWCAGGQLTYVRTGVPTHIGSGLAGLPAALDYLGERFEGAPVSPTCG